jgi:hypothetical protein
MENKQSIPTIDTSAISKGLEQLSRLSTSSFQSMMNNSSRMINEFSNMLGSMGISLNMPAKKETCNCCPPCEECPPKCLITISKSAHSGERIIVPFAVKNTCGTAKHYKVGIRPLMDQFGNAAPVQPHLNKTEIDLQPNQSVTLLMVVDLQGSKEGALYSTEIVIREKEINQNICFHLRVEPFFDIPQAKPLDEKKYLTHFQSWQSHYYCEERPRRTLQEATITQAGKNK